MYSYTVTLNIFISQMANTLYIAIELVKHVRHYILQGDNYVHT